MDDQSEESQVTISVVTGGQGGLGPPCDFMIVNSKRSRYSNRAVSYSNKAVTEFREAV